MKRFYSLVLVITSACIFLTGCWPFDGNDKGNNDGGAQTGHPPKPQPTYQPDPIGDWFQGQIVFHAYNDPIKLAGSLIYHDQNDTNSVGHPIYHAFRLIPNSKDPTPKMENQVLYDSAVDSSFTAGVSYLSFLNDNFGASNRVQITLERIFEANGPDFLDTNIQNALSSYFSNTNNRVAGRQYYYGQDVRYVTLTSKTFSYISNGLRASYMVTIDGSQYSAQNGVNFSDLDAVDYVPLSITKSPTNTFNILGTGFRTTIFVHSNCLDFTKH